MDFFINILFFNLKFEKRIEFLCPYYAADAVPPYPYHRVNTKDYTECCDDHCCTKVYKKSPEMISRKPKRS